MKIIRCEQIEAAPVETEGAAELPYALPDRPRRRRPQLFHAAVRVGARRAYAEALARL